MVLKESRERKIGNDLVETILSSSRRATFVMDIKQSGAVKDLMLWLLMTERKMLRKRLCLFVVWLITAKERVVGEQKSGPKNQSEESQNRRAAVVEESSNSNPLGDPYTPFAWAFTSVTSEETVLTTSGQGSNNTPTLPRLLPSRIRRMSPCKQRPFGWRK